MRPEVEAEIATLEGDLVRWRRDFHAHPEPGFGEFRSASLIASYLEELGYEVRIADDAMDLLRVMHRDGDRIARSYDRAREAGCDPAVLERMRAGGTAVVADLGVGAPTIGFRFDMDCLPIVEAKDAAHRPHTEGFSSRYDGEMHACGHDGHMAIGLGVATALSRLRGSRPGRVRLVFQPAEEGALGGAAAIVARGGADDVDYMIAAHLGLGFPTGEIVGGARFLATSKYRVAFTGTPAHVTNSPQEGRNALLAAAAAALALHAIPPHADGWFSLNVGVLRAGDEQGVTPAWAVMDLGFWAETMAVHDHLQTRVDEVVSGSAAAWGVRAELDLIGQAPTAEPHHELVEVVAAAAQTVPGTTAVRPFVACRAGEDAGFLLDAAGRHGGQGTYVLIGSDLAAPHHSDRFDFDERSLGIGTALLTTVALDLLHGDGVGSGT